MRSKAALWLLAGALFVSAPAAAQNCAGIKSGLEADRPPQNINRDIVGQSLDDIVERGWILFAVYEDFAPYAWDEGGELRGIDIDLGRLIAKELGVEARFYATQADENVDADLRNNVWRGRIVGGPVANVMLHVPYDRELGCRIENVVLSGQYFNESIAIAYRTDVYEDGGPTPAYFRYDEVGVENDSLADFYLSSIGNGILVPKMKRFPSTLAAMEALARHEIAAVMGPKGPLEFGLKEGLAVHEPPLPGLAKRQWTLGVATRHNWRPLSYAVDDAIRAAVEDGRLEKIFAKYKLTFTKPEW